jgi:hypothetical protein
MQLDNDLLGIWLKAETLKKEEIRFLIETIQTQRNQLDRPVPVAVDARLGELATMPPRPRLGDYFSG